MKLSQVKHRLLRLDLGLLAALVICLLAIWPFISRHALPGATDAELHIFRLAELGRLVRAGQLYPRWAPNFYYGYGYPIFNFYAPLAYYVGLIPELMPFWDAVDAVKIVFILSIILGGLGTYAYSTRNWGRLPALVAAAAYVYAPFILFVDPYARGDLAESLSFGIFPVAMWALDRQRTRPEPVTWLLSVLLVAFIVLSHNLMALVFAAIIGGWCLWVHLFHEVPSPSTRKSKILGHLIRYRLPLALLLGIGLAAFFWLVVFLERDTVNLGSLIGQGDNFDFRTHFLSLRELLSPAELIDWSASEPDYVLGLGLVQWVLAGAGLLGLAAGRSRRRSQAGFFALVALVLLFMMLAASRPLWETIPFLPYLQFPWRLLGPAAFALAALAAVGAKTMMALLNGGSSPGLGSGMARWLPVFMVGLIMVSALPLIQVPPWSPDFGPTTALRVLQEELAGRWLGTTSTSDFVPVTVDHVPRPEQSLLDDFAAGRQLDRVNRHTLPEGSSVRSEEITPLHFRYVVNSPSDFLLRLYLFEFPGWKVTIDGQTAEPELGRPEGFIVVPVPAGQHIVEVQFTNTPARRLAYAVSGLSAALAIGYAFLLGSKSALLPPADDESPALLRAGRGELAAVVFFALLLVVLNAVLIGPKGWMRLESPALTAIPAGVDLYADLDGQFALIGYDGPETARPGQTVSITLYWQALLSPDKNYQVFVHLVDGAGQLVAQSDRLNPGDFPTRHWPTDKYVRDTHKLALPQGLTPGTYYLMAGLWLAGQGERLPVVDSTGRTIGDSVLLSRSLVVK
jgi:hypothetical protein